MSWVLSRVCGCSVTSQTGSKRPSEPICQRHWTHFHCLKPLSCTYSMLCIAPLKWVTTKGKSFLFVEKARQWYWYKLPCLFSLLNVFNENQKLIWESCYIVSSVRSSSGYHGLLHIYKPSFSNFSNSSDSKVKVKVKGPNMCYIFKSMGFKDIEYDIPVYQM